MGFFDLPSDAELPSESLRLLEEYKRLVGTERVADTHRAYGRLPHIVATRVAAAINLLERSHLPREVVGITGMLISHARRCQACFRGSRVQLGKLGFDEAALDAMCADPETLPLDHRGRRIVHWALRFANSTPELTSNDFREIAKDGFSRDEVQEIIALAVFWVQNTMFNTAATVALSDD
jgi:alkylhydroperoxidase/carboxymuconolactone decarboxylase family protein YurZ